MHLFFFVFICRSLLASSRASVIFFIAFTLYSYRFALSCTNICYVFLIAFMHSANMPDPCIFYAQTSKNSRGSVWRRWFPLPPCQLFTWTSAVGSVQLSWSSYDHWRNEQLKLFVACVHELDISHWSQIFRQKIHVAFKKMSLNFFCCVNIL
jgi:hypothetical protein